MILPYAGPVKMFVMWLASCGLGCLGAYIGAMIGKETGAVIGAGVGVTIGFALTALAPIPT